MQLVFVDFQSIPFYLIVPADHITINVVKTNGAELIFVLLVILLIVALLVKDVRAVVADHAFVDGYGVAAAVADQIADMSVVLNAARCTMVCMISFQVYIYCDCSRSLLSLSSTKVNSSLW
jgi:hypothetical protein